MLRREVHQGRPWTPLEYWLASFAAGSTLAVIVKILLDRT